MDVQYAGLATVTALYYIKYFGKFMLSFLLYRVFFNKAQY